MSVAKHEYIVGTILRLRVDIMEGPCEYHPGFVLGSANEKVIVLELMDLNSKYQLRVGRYLPDATTPFVVSYDEVYQSLLDAP